LVVDDEPLVRDLLTRWLSDAGYNCGCADSAAVALNFLQRHAVELVTTDIRMPGASGIELMRCIKESFPDAAVLMVTACEDTRMVIQSLTQGAWGYLCKPVQREDLLKQVDGALKRRRLEIEQRNISLELAARVRDQSCGIQFAQEETAHRLVITSMVRDNETGAHIKRIGLFSGLVAEAAGWPPEAVNLIRFAAPMHDIGKVGISDVILCKAGKLTADEYEVMKTHTLIGAQMLSGSASPILRMAEQIARSHHERWDGTGYPDGLAGAAIPQAARIVGVVDVYDAMTHDRVYHEALPEDDVLTVLDQGSGSHFDPDVVRSFFASLDAIRAIAAKESDPTTARIGNAPATDYEIDSRSLVY
jgi:putative two-component system response regulator